MAELPAAHRHLEERRAFGEVTPCGFGDQSCRLVRGHEEPPDSEACAGRLFDLQMIAADHRIIFAYSTMIFREIE